jgi:hypothetical protein
MSVTESVTLALLIYEIGVEKSKIVNTKIF